MSKCEKTGETDQKNYKMIEKQMVQNTKNFKNAKMVRNKKVQIWKRNVQKCKKAQNAKMSKN